MAARASLAAQAASAEYGALAAPALTLSAASRTMRSASAHTRSAYDRSILVIVTLQKAATLK